MPDTSSFRRDYGSGQLDDRAVADTWREQFDHWFGEASDLDQPQAVVLATADTAGRPRARTVLIKSWDDDGFVWATNYDSRKGHDLVANPYAGLCFSWIPLERQVHVEGPVERLTPAESDAIFAARPRGPSWRRGPARSRSCWSMAGLSWTSGFPPRKRVSTAST